MPSSFLDKFDVRGPTLTLVLRDPSSTTTPLVAPPSPPRMWCGGPGEQRRRRRPHPPTDVAATYDDGTFGLSSRLAALFHIGTAANNPPGTASSSSLSGASRYPDGYMLDDGGVLSGPRSESSSSRTASTGSLFSAWDAMRWGGGSSLSRCARDVHPELDFAVSTKDDVRPFPSSAPWMTGASCEATWNPFPIHEVDDGDGGYGHEMMSAPHRVRFGARVSVPRAFAPMMAVAGGRWLPPGRRSTSDGDGGGGGGGTTTTAIGGDGNDGTDDERRELDVGIAYRRGGGRRRRRGGGGTLEVVVGGSPGPGLPIADPTSGATTANGNNHLLVRLAVGRGGKGRGGGDDPSGVRRSIVAAATTTSSSIEYVRGSFRLPNPLSSILRGSGGVSVMPSYDFVEGSARCVVSGDVGSTGLTRVVLRLDADDSTLTVVRELDERRVCVSFFVFFSFCSPRGAILHFFRHYLKRTTSKL